jgi:glyoxylate/hydroxypyruvate reductase A
MDLLFATTPAAAEEWMPMFARHFPDARQRVWVEGDDGPAEFVLAWKPAKAALAARPGLRAIFNLGAGVDALLKHEAQTPGTLPQGVPLIKLDDAGMAAQMVEYVLYGVLRHFRRFDDYAFAQQRREWVDVPAYRREEFTVAVMGLGELGAHVARSVAALGFPTRGWSRSAKQVDGVTCYAGNDEFDAFLAGANVLVSLLPDTPHTRGLINRPLLERLAKGASVINVARGSQVVDADLLGAIADGQISGAILDVFHQEPLDPAHPFWQEPRITLTPHSAARTLPPEGAQQIADKMRALLAGRTVAGIIDPVRGY